MRINLRYVGMGLVLVAAALVSLAASLPPALVSEGFPTIAERAEKMSKAEFARYAATFEGRPVAWDGWVKDTRKKRDGNYEFLVSALPLDAPGQPRVYVLPVSQGDGVKVRKSQRIVFHGFIRRVGMLFGPNIEFTRVKLL